MIRYFIIGFFFITAGLFCYAEETSYYFYVQLKDKNNSPYTLENPSEFLSERAIERRAYFHVPIDSTDLPVNPSYIDQINNLGITVHCTTKWLNGMTVLLNDSTRMAQVRALPFVEYVEYTGNKSNILSEPRKVKANDIDYGAAATQINNLNGSILHRSGFKGENIHIAVIDGGFYGVDTNPAFQTLRDEGRLLGTKNFVDSKSDVFLEDQHGAYVLSAMAADENGIFVGTAPKASYLLIQTEDVEPEFPYEPDFWVSGIEYADSAGIDVATTSLGYTIFDDASLNYSYEDLNGTTVRASIAATMAYNKGILLFNAAGNEGYKWWKYISVPADAQGVITVGAVSADSIPTFFTSYGPSYDGRTKPELCAIGQQTALISANGDTIRSNGTSFATPILAGVTACYLQATKTIVPNFTLDELRTNLFKSGHLFNSPTHQMGYGIPNFRKALDMLYKSGIDFPENKGVETVQKIHIVGGAPIKIHIPNDIGLKRAYLYSPSGVLCGEFRIEQGEILINPNDYTNGLYILKLTAK